jgi:hypothetical protein
VAPLAAPSVEAAAPGDGPPSGLVRVDDFETTLYFLDAHEVTYLQEELKREYSEDHRRLVLESLFDIIDGQFSTDSQLEALLTVDRLLIEFLSNGEYELVAMALHEASTTVRRLVSDDRVMTALRDLPIRMSEPAVILQLLQALDESAKTPVASLLERLFVELQPSALEPMVAWLGGATASPARAAIERAAARLAGEHTSELSRLLDHENESVVRGAIRLAAQLATPSTPAGTPTARTRPSQCRSGRQSARPGRSPRQRRCRRARCRSFPPPCSQWGGCRRGRGRHHRGGQTRS